MSKPKHGWTCFHCGDTFKEERAAQEHFGRSERYSAACQIKAGAERSLLVALRRAETDAAEAWNIIHSETVDAVTAMQVQASRHGDQLRIAEELGYERGLRDGLRMRREELAKLDAESECR